MLTRYTRYSCVIATLLINPVVGLAADDDQTRTVQVQTGDLNLASESGQAALNARVAQAIDEVCGKSVENRDLIQRQQVHACAKQALDSVQSQMERAIAAATEQSKVAITVKPNF